jgi:hypothetical protein
MKVSARRPDGFVLDPVSAQARLKRNRSEQQLRSRSQPRCVCDLSLEAMNLTLTDVSVTYQCLFFAFSQTFGCSEVILGVFVYWYGPVLERSGVNERFEPYQCHSVDLLLDSSTQSHFH